MQTKHRIRFIFTLAAASAVFALTNTSLADEAPPKVSAEWTKPVWLSELSLSAKEIYDDNVLLVSGLGMPEKSSWVNSVSLKLGLNLVPFLADKEMVQTFSLVYQPERFSYQDASAENYTAHRIGTTLKGKSGSFSFSFDNAFLYVDGNKVAPFYALNQLAGVDANQNDKFRNNYAHSVARERRNQSQDRYTALVQYTVGNFFVRPVSSLVFFSLNTELHNTSAAPYKGYQDYADRFDINGGVDFGFKVKPDLAVMFGYRDGYQYHQQFPLAVNADRHFASNHYQRFLVGLEGKLSKTVTLKLAAGPDAHDYGPDAPINHPRTTRLYGEGTLSVALPDNQSLAFTYKQWMFVASTGLVPYVDSTYGIAYHWSANKQWGLDLGLKLQEANYTMGNDVAGSAPSLRDDLDYGASAGVSYAFTPHLVLSVAYNYDSGKNGVSNLAANFQPDYREFTHQLTTFGVQYKF